MRGFRNGPGFVRLSLPGILLLVLLASSAAAAQVTEDATAELIDTVFADLDSVHSPGCALGIIERGRLDYQRGYGMASLEHNVPIDERTVFYAGSVSKQFVAAAVEMAARAGHLSLDDSVRHWFPELPAYADGINVRQLIHHTSGLRDYLTLMAMSGVPFETPVTPEWVLALIARQQALNFPPGSEYLYSNSGYFLLAQLIERATGQSLRDFSEAKFFDPLAMSNTAFHDDRAQVVKNRAPGYSVTDLRVEVNWSPSFDQVGSGGLLTTISDLAAWDQSFYDGTLGAEFWDTLQSTEPLTSGLANNYAFGLVLDTSQGQRRIQHGGAMFGYRAQLSRFPETGLTIAILCNLASAAPGARADRVADILLGTNLPDIPDESDSGQDDADNAETSGPEVVSDSARLRAWRGTFVSDELAATAVISREGEGLTYQVGLAAPVPLTVYEDNTSSLSRLSMQATLGDDGSVATFTIEAGRVRGILFRRQR